MNTIGEGCFQRAAAAAQNSKIGTGGAAHRSGTTGGWVDHGHHALMAIDAFRRAGGYDEGFSHNEDAELDLRLAADGGRIWLATDLVLDYHPRARPAALFRQYLNYGRGRAKTVARHKTPLKPRQMLPLAVAPAVGLAILALLAAPVAPWSLVLAGPALAWALACLLAGLLIGLKLGQPCAAASGAAAMVMHLGWSLGYWRQWLTGEVAPRRLPFLEPQAADGASA
jgi:succinoglycan biosynthesis protein ExoA